MNAVFETELQGLKRAWRQLLTPISCRSTASTLKLDQAEDVEVLEDNEEIDLSTLSRMSEDAPVVRLVNVLLVDALRRGASDIHVEPYEKELRIRFRIDGVLYDVMHPPLKLRDALISRVKIMSKLDISEKRLPQDGRIKIKVKVDSRSRELDFSCLYPAYLVWRESGSSSAGQRKPDARHDEVRF